MKVGLRTPSLKRSVKARTTGRVKRAAKRAVNPVYGKKGTGFLTDPERSVKNKIYHTVTVDPLAPIKNPVNTGNGRINNAKKSGFRPRHILFIFTIVSAFMVALDIFCGTGHTVFLGVMTAIYFIIYLIMRKNGL